MDLSTKLTTRQFLFLLRHMMQMYFMSFVLRGKADLFIGQVLISATAQLKESFGRYCQHDVNSWVSLGLACSDRNKTCGGCLSLKSQQTLHQ